MSLYKKCHEIAAGMVGGGDPGLLNHRLFYKLSNIDGLCQAVGAELVSIEVIAVIVNDWIASNDEKPYGD